MQVKVELFGVQARLVGERTVWLDYSGPELTCQVLRQLLLESYPCLSSSLPHSRIAVNHCFSAENQVVSEQDEVALIGMVSGG